MRLMYCSSLVYKSVSHDLNGEGTDLFILGNTNLTTSSFKPHSYVFILFIFPGYVASCEWSFGRDCLSVSSVTHIYRVAYRDHGRVVTVVGPQDKCIGSRSRIPAIEDGFKKLVFSQFTF
jgi:hypothetical protein